MDTNSKAALYIDWLNVFFIFASLIVAIKLPFKLFLFAYAFLGPLHYLTEINWLKKKNFFVKSSFPLFKICATVAILLSLYPLYKLLNYVHLNSFEALLKTLAAQGNFFILTTFFICIGVYYASRLKEYVLVLITALTFAYLLSFLFPKIFLVLGLFLPTIFHVFLFTGLFMLYGGRKAKNKLGIMAAVLLFICPFIIYLIPINPLEYQFSAGLLSTFSDSNMFTVSQQIAAVLGIDQAKDLEMISELGLKIQIFIAFAYTYHYLNWFSKTSIIGWKESINQGSLIWILLVWILAIVIYSFDYNVGFTALFFLSYLHVFLEFPLNFKTMKALISS